MNIFSRTILIICLILPASALAGKDTIVLQCDFEPPQIRANGRYVSITMGDLPLMRKGGQPVLPFKPVRILIPRGKEIQDIEIEEGEKVTLEGNYLIEPAQQAIPLSYRGSPIEAAPNRAIYSSLSPFPQKIQTDVSIQEKGPYRLLLLNINPISCVLARSKISYFKSIKVTVSLRPAAEIQAIGPQGHISQIDEESIRKKVHNPEALRSYNADIMTHGPLQESGAPGDYTHVIITSLALANAAGAYTFQTLRDHRTAHGINSTIVTTDYIYSNFDGTRPDGDPDNQTRIRNFISWAYENWGTAYVLLGGYSGIIPIRRLNADGTNIPADMYYGNLDGTFDNDADGIYGEPNDGVGGGEVDLYAEVYIGRACVENETDASNFVRKIIAYETSSSDSLSLAYLVGEHLGFSGDSEYAKPSMEEIRIGSCAHDYCTKGFTENESFQTETLYDADSTWPKSQLISIINSGVHILNHLGHASYDYDMRLYTSDLPSLTNTDYFFTYSQGCMPGGFDTSNCFGEVVTTMEHGAFAAVLNASYGWGRYNSTAGPSQYYNREFWDALFGEGIKALGRMNADSKEDNDLRISGGRMRWCFYELNLFGDPATKIHNITSKGSVNFSDDVYSIQGAATAIVMDFDLDIDPDSPDTVSVAVKSDTEGTPESLQLTETGASTKTFRGSITITAGSAIPGDGTLQVSDGDTLTVLYHDADDGTGNSADVQDTAIADGTGPVISNVQCSPSVMSCTITWETSEPGDSLVRYGQGNPPSTEIAGSTLVISHSLLITGLEPLTTYYFEVASTDSVGNTATENNGGNYYQFTTLERGAVLFVDDDEGDSYESYFTGALDANSYSYDVWDVSAEGLSPEASCMESYYIVIWNCGEEWMNETSGLTTSEQNALSEYMDGGGSVFLCGQDIIYNGLSPTFKTNYLHLSNYNVDDQTTQANGIEDDRISDEMSFSLSYPFSNWSDSLTPDTSSCGAFLTNGSTTHPYCATRYPAEGISGLFKIVFFAFPFESIGSTSPAPNNASMVMDRVLLFLSPVEIDEVSPPYGLNDRENAISVKGSGFNSVLNVSLGPVSLTVSSSESTEISATVPTGLAAGHHDITTRNSADTSKGYLASAYTSLDSSADDDLDGLSNEDEVVTHKTNPLLSDTDGDGYSDSLEVTSGSNPLDSLDTPTGLSKLAVLKLTGMQAGDANLYYYNGLVDGDWTYWDAISRNPSAYAMDFWVIPVGNDAIGMAAIGGTFPERFYVLKQENVDDVNLYLYDSLIGGDRTYWNAIARNPSPVARDLWVMPAGNDAIGIASVDINGGAPDELAILKREGAGDMNLYYYNALVAGDWTYWDAISRNPSPLARDFWAIPIGNDAVGIATIDVDGAGYDELAIIREEGVADLNLYVYNNLVAGDWTYWDAVSRNPSPLARDLWIMPSGNDAIDLTTMDADGDGYNELAILKGEGASDVNLYYYNALVPGDWTYWDAISRNPSPYARDLWVIPIGNDAIGMTGIRTE